MEQVTISQKRKDNTIIRLESFDGIHWTRTATLLTPIDGTWETYVNRACVIQVDGVWHMWYTGQSPDVSKIGHATSVNGISYVRDSRNPVLQKLTEGKYFNV